MWHLMKSELLRFRGLAIGFAIVHLLCLGLISMLGQLLSNTVTKITVAPLLYSLAGLIFGLYQMGSHRAPNRWAYLIHRPLSPTRILLALVAAATVLAALVVALPLFLMTLYSDLLTNHWVDLRHYLLTPFVLGLSLCFYLAGCFISLSNSKAAVLVLVLPYFFLTRGADGLWIFLPLVLVLLWLTFLTRAAFKPDLSAHLTRPAAISLAALPMQYALLWMLSFSLLITFTLTVIFQSAGWRGPTVHRWDHFFPAGTVEGMAYHRDAQGLEHGLRDLEGPEVSHLRQQLQLAEVHTLQPRFASHPVRHQPMFVDRLYQLTDGEHGTRWTFSHDRMMFHGFDPQLRQAMGWLGARGFLAVSDPTEELDRFPQVPYTVGNRFVLTEHQLYEVDFQTRRVILRYETAGEERLTTSFAEVGRDRAVITDRRLYLFAGRDFEEEGGRLQPFLSVDLPGSAESSVRPSWLHMAELIDGYLLSFVFGTDGSPGDRGYRVAYEQVLEVAMDGGVRVIAERDLEHHFPAWVRHRAFILSPLMRTLHDLVWAWIEPWSADRVSPRVLLSTPLPAQVLRWAVLLTLASALLTYWIGRRRQLSSRALWAWTCAALFCGIPGWISFLFLTHRRESPLPQARDAKPGLQQLQGKVA